MLYLHDSDLSRENRTTKVVRQKTTFSRYDHQEPLTSGMDPPLFFLLLITGLYVPPSCLSIRYHFISEPKTFTDAHNYCSQNHTGLATSANMTELGMFNTVMANWTDKTEILLKTSNSTWRWSLDGTELGEEKFWETTQTQQHSLEQQCVKESQEDDDQKCCCVVIIDETWDYKTCENTHPFVCFDEHNQTNQYIYIETLNKKWTDSRDYCKQKHTDLASVRNITERDYVKNISSTNNPVWIGLRKVPLVWGWSNQSVNSYTSNQNATYPCICYDDELVLVQENKTWLDAVSHCREHGWELVSVLNQNIQDWVQRRAQNASSPFVWLGLRYSCALGFWFWVSGNDSCYQNWAGGQNHNTASEQARITGAMNRTGGQWVSQPENETYYFICSRSHDY
ncbi:hypothetical protein DPEC_G00229530 [Dallia pectoralis]|uniref:Uncharacterized protein n=1 Tax=Dallia pectoralis TaxID=75939 RepID=A0ACC2G1Q6_DALPE|nr:hypothetical protein DPEC_G00229530 [Dallia pectoralis]